MPRKIEEGALGVPVGRLIRFGSLNRLVQVVMVITIAQVVITGIALAANGGSQPQTITHATGAGELIQVPLAVYVISLVSSVLGWSFLLVASLQSSRGAVRLFLLFFALGLLSAEPVAYISEAALGGTGLSPGQALFPVTQLLAIALLLCWGVSISARGGWLGLTHNSSRWLSIAFVSALVCLYYTMDVIAVLVYDPQASAQGFVPSSVATLSTLLPVALAVIVYWASTDFIEWGEVAAANAATLARRIGPPWLLAALIALLSTTFIFDVARRISLVGLAPSLVTACVLIGLAILLLRLAGVNGASPAQVPAGALVAGAIFLFLVVQGALFMTESVSRLLQLSPAQINPLYTLVSVSMAIALLITALFLIARARRDGRREIGATGAFLGMMAILVIGLSTPQLANVMQLPVIKETQPNIAAFKLLAGGATLIAIVWLAMRGRLAARVVAPLTAALLLVVGLQVIGWYFQVFLPSLNQLTGRSAILASMVFVVAILWDLLTSGDTVTNRESQAFPRSTRVLLYLAYALLASSTFLFATSQHLVSTGAAVSLPSDGIALEVVGAEGLGLPLLAYAFAQRLGRWRDGQRDKS